MTSSLLKTAQAFYRLSQDQFQAVKQACENALRARFSDPNQASIKTVSLIDRQVKVDIHLSDVAAKQTNLSELTKTMKFAVGQIDPSLQVSVTLDLSTNYIISDASRKNFRKSLRHKLAQNAPGNVQSVIEESLKGIPGSRLTNLSVADTMVDAQIEVPQEHSFTASQLGTTLTRAIQTVLPGGRVNVTLNFQTKTASRAKRAQDQQAAVQAAVAQALQGLRGVDLKSFVYQPETKHVLVEVAKANGSQISAQQISSFLTGKLQAVAPGFSAIATATTVL